MNSKNTVYAFLFMAIVLSVAFLSDLLAYSMLGKTFFILGFFVLGIFLVLSVFLLGNWVGMLFSFALFSTTLLTASILFPLLFAEPFLALLFLSGSLGFIATFVLWPKQQKKWNIAGDMPPMPLIDETPKQNLRVSTYDLKNPTAPVLDSVAESSLSDDDFVELDELDKLIQPQKQPPKTAKKIKKGNGRRKRNNL